ncbi:expressed unknown protein [Seminavis robusta]|uniref:Uncharacterized protein n=1 Tax=Seminavis robusta TaxID=568900 RepID=A0A9N8EXM6_9STRA|nr:expressed unknown protein [Seminavis robusta]|eukprot:Sro2178_g317880.1 n/a (265) ;mRNA; r:6248-7042
MRLSMNSLLLLCLLLALSCHTTEASKSVGRRLQETQDEEVLMEEVEEEDQLVVIPVPAASLHDDTPSAPVPVVPVPTPPPGNRTQHPTTPSPTITPDDFNTTAPTTVAPTSVAPTPAPSHKNETPAPTHETAPPTSAPTTAATGLSFFRMMGKMIAWCILLGLGVLLYGFCIQHQYQIAYYARHCGHCLVGVNQWLLQKIRPSHNLHSGYAAMYASERNDAQSSALLFDAPDNSFFGAGGNNGDYHDGGFVMGQHSNQQFQSMG